MLYEGNVVGEGELEVAAVALVGAVNSRMSKLPAEVLHLQVLDGGWVNQLPRWGGS